MKVRMLTGMAGVGIDWWDGDVVEVTHDEAERLIKAGQAERYQETEIETAVVGPTETAALKFKPRHRRR
jgi:hypothetical protein